MTYLDPIKMVRLTAFVRKAETANVTELPASSQDFLSTYHLKMLLNLQVCVDYFCRKQTKTIFML